MTDLFFIAVALGFFGLSIAYVYGCERLRSPAPTAPITGGNHD
jgi:hypothetical protein